MHQIDEKFQLIYSLSNLDLFAGPQFVLIQGILNTIDLTTLIKVYVEALESPRYYIEKNILKRLEHATNKESLYEYLFSQLQDETYIERLRIRKFVDILVNDLDDTYKLEYFEYFFKSVYIHERNAAIRFSPQIWSDDLKAIFVEEYLSKGSEEILKIILLKADEDILPIILEAAWNWGISNAMKTRCIKKFDLVPFKSLNFLNRADPGNYIVAIRIKGAIVNDEELLNIYRSVPDFQKPFAIWNLGKMQHWNLIKEDIESFLENPKVRFSKFYEYKFL
jgi:hypothetical protein